MIGAGIAGPGRRVRARARPRRRGVRARRRGPAATPHGHRAAPRGGGCTSTRASSSTTSTTTPSSRASSASSAWRCRTSDMSFSVSCALVRRRVLGRAPAGRSRGAPAAAPSVPASSPRSMRWLRTARRSLEERLRGSTLGRVRGGGRLLARLPRPLSSCRSPRRSGRRRPSGRSTSRPPTRSASSRTTACSASGATGGGRCAGGSPHLRGGDPRPLGARRLHLGAERARASRATPTASSCGPTTTGRTASTPSSSPSHGDQALRCSATRRATSASVLGAFRHAQRAPCSTPTRALLPRARAARASWNYQLDDCRRRRDRPTITYYLNTLQRLDGEPSTTA